MKNDGINISNVTRLVEHCIDTLILEEDMGYFNECLLFDLETLKDPSIALVSPLSFEMKKNKINKSVSDDEARQNIRQLITKMTGIVTESKEQVEIEVSNEGILEVPEGKKVDELPFEHFKNLADKKGLQAISRALTNLAIWNKDKNPQLSRWANSTQDKLTSWVEDEREDDEDFAN